jgi:hypothetical protein
MRFSSLTGTLRFRPANALIWPPSARVDDMRHFGVWTMPCGGARLGQFGCGLDHAPGEPLSSFVDKGRDISQLVGTNASH